MKFYNSTCARREHRSAVSVDQERSTGDEGNQKSRPFRIWYIIRRLSPPQISIPPSPRPSIIISKSTSAETDFTSPYLRITCIWAPPLPHLRTNSTRVDGSCNPPQSTALLVVGHTGLGLLRVDRSSCG
ncbi:hypothetical protein Peur_048030 [Populus x canadensis]